MHSYHPYVQRRRKRRRIGGRVVERRTVSQGKNVLFTTQVRRGVLRLFGISSAVFPPGSARHHHGLILKSLSGEEWCPRQSWAWSRDGAPPAMSAAWEFASGIGRSRSKFSSESLVPDWLLLGLLYLSKERRLMPLKAVRVSQRNGSL